jgi:hypothetical protein
MNRRLRNALLLVALAGWVSACARPARAEEIADHFGTAAPAAAQDVPDSVHYAVKSTNNNLLGILITNYGFIGNNFVSRSPSMEYPLGSGFDHLVRGGLWIGARAIDDLGAFTGVSTAAIDGTAGSSAQAGTEYTPACLDIRERSSLPKSPSFDPEAVSQEDMIAFYRDQPARQFSPENHRPLNVLVRQENYDWSFAGYAHLVIFHYVVTNVGLPLRNVYVGVYNELASGDKKLCSSMPPSSGGCLKGGWFRKKWVQYDDSLRLFREHYCFNLPVSGGCDSADVPYWAGYRLLGAKVGAGKVSVLADTSYHVTMAAWKYSLGDTARDEDVERYAIMSSGLIQDLSGPDFQPYSGDPCELIAVGPFKQIDPGDSISVDFAFVCGAEVASIQEHSRLAQRAYDLDYVIPVPPPSPTARLVAREHALDIYWNGDKPESFEDRTSPVLKDFEGYRVYAGEDRFDLGPTEVGNAIVLRNLVAQLDRSDAPHDTTGFNTGLDSAYIRDKETGDRDSVRFLPDTTWYKYKYTITGLRDGFKYFAAVTAYDLGTSEIEPLESGVTQNKAMAIPGPASGEAASELGDKVVVFPNPYRVEGLWDVQRRVRDHYLWFTNLPRRCHLRIYTLSGDLVFETAFDGSAYAGGGARGVYDPSRDSDVAAPALSGTTYAWNMITREGQAAATGLYLFSVEDLSSARKPAVGKFLIVKSDREQ